MKQTMWAAVVNGDKRIEVQEVPTPHAESGEVVVRVDHCGICGSEVAAYARGKLCAGSIIGHELAGYVAEVGQGVDGWHVGNRVVVGSYGSCGICAWCRRGQQNMCLFKYWIGLGFNPGGMAEYCKVKASMLFAVPDEMSLLDATLVEPLAIALHAIQVGRPCLGDTAAIIGAGTIGLLLLQAVRLSGAVAVAVIDSLPKRLENAARLSATACIVQEEATESSLAATLGEAPLLIFDCRVRAPTVQLSAEIALRHGTIIFVGVNAEPVPITPKDWMRKELTLRTVMGYSCEYPIAIRLIAERRVDVTSLVSHIVTLDQIDDVLKALSKPRDYGKVLVKM